MAVTFRTLQDESSDPERLLQRMRHTSLAGVVLEIQVDEINHSSPSCDPYGCVFRWPNDTAGACVEPVLKPFYSDHDARRYGYVYNLGFLSASRGRSWDGPAVGVAS